MEKKLNVLGDYKLSDISNIMFSSSDEKNASQKNIDEKLIESDILIKLNDLSKAVEKIKGNKNIRIENEALENLKKQFIQLVYSETSLSFNERKLIYSKLFNYLAPIVDIAVLMNFSINIILVTQNIDSLRFFLGEIIAILWPRDNVSNLDHVKNFLEGSLSISNEKPGLAVTIFCESMKLITGLDEARQQEFMLLLEEKYKEFFSAIKLSSELITNIICEGLKVAVDLPKGSKKQLMSFLKSIYLIGKEHPELAATIFCEGLKVVVRLPEDKQSDMLFFLQNSLTLCIARQDLIGEAIQAHLQKLNKIFSISENEMNLLDKEDKKIQALYYGETDELIEFLNIHKAGLFLTTLLLASRLPIVVASELYKETIILRLKDLKIDVEQKLYSLLQRYMMERISCLQAAKCNLSTAFGAVVKDSENRLDMLLVDKRYFDQTNSLSEQNWKIFTQHTKLIEIIYNYWQGNKQSENEHIEKSKLSKTRLKK